MLTLQDLLKIENIVDKKLDEKLEEKFDEKLKFFPTKEEYFSKMDKIIGELKASREAFELHTGQHTRVDDELENHNKRIKKIEQHIHPSPLPAA
jgi:hypothetical protein